MTKSEGRVLFSLDEVLYGKAGRPPDAVPRGEETPTPSMPANLGPLGEAEFQLKLAQIREAEATAEFLHVKTALLRELFSAFPNLVEQLMKGMKP